MLLSAALAAMAIAGLPVAAGAQAAGTDRQIVLAIPAQNLADALRQLAEASGLQLVYDAKIAEGKSSPGVSGTMSTHAAVAKLLAGSGLSFRFSGDQTVVITSSAADGVHAVGVVSVEGVSGMMPYNEMVSPVNGTNGSRDVETTKGTGSYTTGATSIVSKIPQTLRETPQAVSVITSQQIADQNLVSIRDILDTMPGTTYVPGPDSEEFNIYSRGFRVDTFTFDGGAPVIYNNNVRPVFNTSEFDSVQLVRGANGLFGGYGDPGGTVNLVRKKPLDHQQLIYTQNIGLYDHFREELDETTPLTENGKLRARAVLTREDTQYFYKVANSHKTGIYGILEFDATPSTLLTAGASYNRERNTPNFSGLPRYTNGQPIDFPTSTCLCLPFAYDHADRTELFASINQKVTSAISMKLNVTYNNQRTDTLIYTVSGDVVQGGSTMGTFGPYRAVSPIKDFAADYALTGKFDVLGRENNFAVGGSYRHVKLDGANTDSFEDFTVPDLLHFDPGQYTRSTTLQSYYHVFISRETNYGIYANLRLELLKGLHVQTGIRYSGYSDTSSAQYSYNPGDPTQTSIQPPEPLKDHSHSSPNIGITYDFLKNFTLFGSHAKIYQPQIYSRQTTTKPVPPVTGVNDEAGLKWQSPNKKINASVSYYRIVQKGFLSPDYSNQTNQAAYVTRLNDTRAKGFDVEVAGELLPGWQVSANYTYSKNTFTQSAYPTGSSTTTGTSFQPRNKVKLFTTYRGRPGSAFSRLIVGGGMNYQSSAYNAGYVCLNPPADPSQFCPFVPYNYATKGYATYTLMVGVKVSDNLEVTVTGKNITNVKAYSPSPYQNVSGYNFYVEPANVLASVRLKF